MLCYRTSSKGKGHRNVVQVFAAGCPRGFAQVPQADLGATQIVGVKGVDGAQGPQGDAGTAGAKGPTGDKGLNGPKGNTGDQGLQGDKGDQGLPGEKGDKGNTGGKGSKGNSGDQGDSGKQLFNFSGTSGSLRLDKPKTYCPLNGLDSNCFQSDGSVSDSGISLLPINHKCSAISFYFELEKSPGATGRVMPFLYKRLSDVFAQGKNLCLLNGSNSSCTGQTSVQFTADTTLSYLLIETSGDVGAPRFRWNIKCIDDTQPTP